MSVLQPRGNQILVDTGESIDSKQVRRPGQALTSWLWARKTKWERHRDGIHRRRWAEYWRLWRGQWSEEDRNRASERSRLIAPALSQAIEMTVSELEEGLFSKEVWFDIVDDIADQDKVDAMLARDTLREDLDLAGVTDAVGEAILNGAIFGTGILKLGVEVVKDTVPSRNDIGQLESSERQRVALTLDAIRPDEFIPDPAGRNVRDMLGCFHSTHKPLHAVLEKIERGVYRKDALIEIGSQRKDNVSEIDSHDPEAFVTDTDTDTVNIAEYHGKVPLEFLNDALEDTTPIDRLLRDDNRSLRGDGPLVEAIVTVANGSVLLRAMVNPFVMKDRSIIAFQFEKVPARFWGRGVAEKGINPQKALDAELRARIDALGYISAPMLGIDSGRIPRGFKMEVRPGKVWLTQGNPNEVIQPIKIGDIQPNTFNQTQEMERMVSMGTGAFDTAVGLKSQGSQANGPSATNISLMMGAFVKRAKRAIRNVNDNLVRPLIRKSMWRMMQFDGARYPKDFDFTVKATLGMVAREVEAMQMTQLIGMLPEPFPEVSLAVAKGIVELSSIHNKAEILQLIEQKLQPPPPEVQKRQEELAELQHEAAKEEFIQSSLDNQKVLAEIRKLLNEAEVEARKSELETVKSQQEDMRILIQEAELQELARQNDIANRRLDLQERQLRQKAQSNN